MTEISLIVTLNNQLNNNNSQSIDLSMTEKLKTTEMLLKRYAYDGWILLIVL